MDRRRPGVECENGFNVSAPHGPTSRFHPPLAVYLVISSVGPEKLVPGRNRPAATSLHVSCSNRSESMVTLAFRISRCSSSAVVKPTTPAPTTHIFIVDKVFFASTVHQVHWIVIHRPSKDMVEADGKLYTCNVGGEREAKHQTH